MENFKETCVDYLTTDDYATFCSSEKRWINKINKLHEKNPSEVQIIYTPEDNGGVLYARIPKSWLKISPPRKINLTETQRAAAADRLRNARKGKE